MASPRMLKAALARLADDDRAKLRGVLTQPQARPVRKASRSAADKPVPSWAWPSEAEKKADIRRLGRQPRWDYAAADVDPLKDWDAD
jgi:hypothetical protein